MTDSTGKVELCATTGIQLQDSLHSVGIPGLKPITLAADSDGSGEGTFKIGQGSTLFSNNNNLTIITKDVDIVGYLETASAPIFLLNSFNGQTIGLGGAQRPHFKETKHQFGMMLMHNHPVAMHLTNEELGRIKCTGLQLGSTTSGTMLVEGAYFP